jgi:hypothetical protein
VSEHWPVFRERAEEHGGLPRFVELRRLALFAGETAGFVFEWLPPIDTAGEDSRVLTKELAVQYEARFARHVRERSVK